MSLRHLGVDRKNQVIKEGPEPIEVHKVGVRPDNFVGENLLAVVRTFC